MPIVCNGTATPRAEEGRSDAEAPPPGVRHAVGRADDHLRRLEERRPGAAGRDARRSSTSSARSRRPCSNWPAKASCTGRRTPASGRRVARSARSSACARRDAVNGSHRGHHQFLAKALTHVGGIRSDLADACHARDPGGPAAHARRDPRPRAGLLPRPRRLDAPAVVRGRRARHERDRRRRRADGDRQRVGAEALRHHRPHDQLLRRRGEPDRLGAGDDEPRRGMEAAGRLLHREQPLRRLDARLGDHRRHSALRARAGVRHPVMAGRRHGPARRASRDDRGRRARMRVGRRARPSSRPRSTASSTRTAPTRAAPSATAPRRRRRSGASAIRCSAWPPRCRSSAWSTDGRGRLGARAGAGGDARRGGRAARADPENAGKRRIRPDLWPDPEFVDVGVRGDASELAEARDARPGRPSTGHGADRSSWMPSPRSWTAAWSRTRASSCSARTCTGSPGGTNGATKGLAARFARTACSARRSARTRSPVSAGGLALDGRFRPVVEFMYPDFMWVAADQVFNQIGKARHMFGGDNPVPLVLRTKVAMGSGYGSQHLMDPAGSSPRAPAGASSRPRPPPTTSA